MMPLTILDDNENGDGDDNDDDVDDNDHELLPNLDNAQVYFNPRGRVNKI
jgi:hypothetical protein